LLIVPGSSDCSWKSLSMRMYLEIQQWRIIVTMPEPTTIPITYFNEMFQSRRRLGPIIGCGNTIR
jgi:hypothetical protein